MPEVVPFPVVPQMDDGSARAHALDIRSSCIVEAPAGSGKTGLLVQRYLKLLADETVQSPEEVLAVTFTRKATAELRERVLQQLLGAKQALPLAHGAGAFERTSRELALSALQRSERLQWKLLEQPQRLNIQTFDAVAMQISNALPVLSGSGGPREPMDNAGALHRVAARRTLLQLGGGHHTLHEALRTLLLHRDGNLADCEQLIAEMLQKREQWGELVPLGRTLDDATLDNEVRPRLERALAGIVESALRRAHNATPSAVLKHLTAFAQRHAGLPGHNDALSPIAAWADRHEPPRPVAADLDHWLALIGLVLKPSDGDWRKSLAVNHLGFKPSKDVLDEFKLFIASIQTDELQAALGAVFQLPPATYPEEQWLVAKALFYILRHALVELKLLFAQRGECDFTELALAAREALHRDPTAADLVLSGGGQLRHMLIDEMQDTSAGQYELIGLLTQSWDGHHQTLFLVGDPKQSIYLFRAASVERFLRTIGEERFGEIRLTPLRLTANFRSQEKLVTEFNRSFELLFLKPGEAGTEAVDVPFVASTAKREPTQEDGIVWHTAEFERDAKADHARQEALTIRRIVEERLAQPLPDGRTKPWRIAVLGHGRKHLAAVIAEFNTLRGGKKLAFKAIDLDPLSERTEVLDVLALTRALLHPADRVAWLAVLHAPWCGLGLADMLALTGGDEDRSTTTAVLVSNRRHLISSGGQRLLDRVWPVLSQATEGLGRTPLSVQVERAWRSLGGDAALTQQQQTNVLRYLGVLREVEAEGNRVDLDMLHARLDKLYAEPLAGDAQVELLTVHKSKGLEWDVVLVPGLERGSGRDSQPLLNWLEFDPASAEDEAAVILAPIEGKGSTNGALSRWLKGLRSRREAAERKRLFYVACTRAREELHLFAALERNNDGALKKAPHNSLLRACWPAAEPQFTSAGPQNAGTLIQMPAPTFYEADEGLALAATADLPARLEELAHRTPMLQRLPHSFDPAKRFVEAEARRLDYPQASTLEQAPVFERPEGSYAVRAFGNVVHRYLQLLADRLPRTSAAELLAELPGWQTRLETSLRGEGIPPRDAAAESARALKALTLTLNDPTGLWLLSPHTGAASESELTDAARSLRVDRTFLAGEQPLSTGTECIWIVDFKTAERGTRSEEAFAAAETAKYRAQLESYACLRRNLPDGALPIRLGLYYPLLPRLIHWTASS